MKKADFRTFLRDFYHYFTQGERALWCCSVALVLIVLWVMASIGEPSYLSVTVCFAVFLVNDSYTYINWRRLQKRQGEKSGA